MKRPERAPTQEGPLRASFNEGPNIFQAQKSREETQMKYLVAWGLGVPGVLIVAWFLMSHH
jgi:hypothetical protein